MMKLKTFLIALFAGIGIGIASYLSFMLFNFPLFDFAVTDIIWTREWLYMTIIDYYGAVASLSVIVYFSEQNKILAILWVLGFCLLGSPICCCYIIYRLKYKTIKLFDSFNANDSRDLPIESTTESPFALEKMAFMSNR